MTLPISSSSCVKVNPASLDQFSSPSAKTSMNQTPFPSGFRVSHHPVGAPRAPDELLVSNERALTQLFEMMQEVLGILREMLSGGNVTPPDPLPATDKLPGRRWDTGKLPVTPRLDTTQTLAPDAHTTQAELVVPSTFKPDVAVTRDARENVQVNVNLSHCQGHADTGVNTNNSRFSPRPMFRS